MTFFNHILLKFHGIITQIQDFSKQIMWTRFLAEKISEKCIFISSGNFTFKFSLINVTFNLEQTVLEPVV